MATVLTVEADEKLRGLLERVLTRRGHQVLTAVRGQDAIELFQRERPLVTILDLQLPDMNGLSVLRQIRELIPSAPVVVLTDTDTTEVEADVKDLGATDVFHKCLSLHVVADAVSRLLGQSSDDKDARVDAPNSGEPSCNDRRKYPRVGVHLPITLFKDGVYAGEGEIEDLSLGGCAFTSTIAIEQGDYVSAQLSVPDQGKLTHPLVVDLAVVRWARASKYGVEFIVITPQHQARLRDHVRTFLAGAVSSDRTS